MEKNPITPTKPETSIQMGRNQKNVLGGLREGWGADLGSGVQVWEVYF